MSFFLSWIKNYVKNPLELGAILPTYKFAANLMTKNIISNEKTIVVELGAGTGDITKSIINRGILQENLILVEINEDFCKILKQRFPKTQIFCEDAKTFFKKSFSNEKKIDYIVSGLPFVAMSKAQKMEICELSFDNLSENGIFFQITYFVKCSFPVEIINKNKLIKKMIGFTLLNIPPAFIWSIARRN